MAVDVRDGVQESEDQANVDALHNEQMLTVPDMYNTDSISQFTTLLEQRQNKHGVIGLVKLVYKCKDHIDLADKQLQRIKLAVERLNGNRTPLQTVGDKSRSLRNTAKRFYESLSTQGLRMQCKLFNIDYDSFESQEEIITTLVQAHVDMNV